MPRKIAIQRRYWIGIVTFAFAVLLLISYVPTWAAPVPAPHNQTVPMPTPKPDPTKVPTATPYSDKSNDNRDDDRNDGGNDGAGAAEMRRRRCRTQVVRPNRGHLKAILPSIPAPLLRA